MKIKNLESSTITTVSAQKATKEQLGNIILDCIVFAGGYEKFLKGELTIIFNK